MATTTNYHANRAYKRITNYNRDKQTQILNWKPQIKGKNTKPSYYLLQCALWVQDNETHSTPRDIPPYSSISVCNHTWNQDRNLTFCLWAARYPCSLSARWKGVLCTEKRTSRVLSRTSVRLKILTSSAPTDNISERKSPNKSYLLRRPPRCSMNSFGVMSVESTHRSGWSYFLTVRPPWQQISDGPYCFGMMTNWIQKLNCNSSSVALSRSIFILKLKCCTGIT